MIKSNNNYDKAITLISLVITIILLIILAGISINLSIGENGLLNKAKYAKEKTNEEYAKEKLETVLLYLQTAKLTDYPDYTYEDIASYIVKNNMKIDGDIVEVDDWKFKIDKNVPKIIQSLGKVNDVIKIELETTYIGTSSFTININASSKQAKIVEYKYKINNGEEIAINKSSITIENLEPETEYEIIASVIDERGNQKSNNPIKVKTKKRQYIIKDGVLKIEGISNGYATGEQKNGFFEINTSRTGGYFRSTYAFRADLSNYKEIKADLEIGKKDSLPELTLFIANSITDTMEDTPKVDGKSVSTVVAAEGTLYPERKISKLNIEKLKGNYYVCFNQNMVIGSATWKIYNLWLEE